MEFDPERQQELARVRRDAQRNGLKGLAALARRVGRDQRRADIIAVDSRAMRDRYTLTFKIEGTLVRAWRRFLQKEDRVDVIERVSRAPDETFEDWQQSTDAYERIPLGDDMEIRQISPYNRAAMDTGLSRALERIAVARKTFSDAQAEQIIFDEIGASLSKVRDFTLDGLWLDLEPDLPDAVRVLWPEAPFKHAIAVLIRLTFTPLDEKVIEALAMVLRDLSEEAPVQKRALWRRVAEAMRLPGDHADRLKMRYFRLRPRLLNDLPHLAKFYSRDSRNFDPFAFAEKALRGELHTE